MICEVCGGTKRQRPCDDVPVCLLCELFQQGLGYDLVERCRHNNPQPSEGVAVHPDLIQQTKELARYRGVSTDFDKEGRPLFESRAHKKRYLKEFGFVNRDGGYGD